MHSSLHFLNLNKLLFITGIFALILIVVFWFWWGSNSNEIDIKNGDSSAVKNNLPQSPISGISCDNYNRRPVAVMLSSDAITRPLSGISQADIVFEMPVTPGGVTRLMAVYQCEEPKEIGSIRSAREDFIPLAAGINALYAHWGGEKGALKKLDGHIMDNIDAMVYETVYFYRKKGTPQPHNGFTSFEKLKNGSKDLKYNLDNKFIGYPHSDKNDTKNILNIADSISINYPRPFNVEWRYNLDSKTYKRFRDSQSENDKNNDSQVAASVVAVIKTTSTFTSKDYLTVTTTGEGDAIIYQGGIKISGKWSKDPSKLDSKLLFYDNEGKEIEFTPGKIWVEIVTD